MDGSFEYERTSIEELIEAHKRRLHELNLRYALQGDDTPPHVTIEIERITETVRQLEHAASYPVSAQVIKELGPVGRYQLWMSNIMRVESEIWQTRQDVKDLKALIEKVRDRVDERFDSVFGPFIAQMVEEPVNVIQSSPESPAG